MLYLLHTHNHRVGAMRSFPQIILMATSTNEKVGRRIIIQGIE